jgi:flagellin
MAGLVVSNQAAARTTLTLVDNYRNEILNYRAALGATVSRIGTFVNTLRDSEINYQAASSRITDADIAEESSKSVAANIRQQVATSILRQANLVPEIGLRLLRA